MLNDIKFYIVISEIISLILIIKVWAGSELRVLKVMLSVAIAIPFIGPLVYFFAVDNPTNGSAPNDYGPRGSYTHSFISMKPLLKKIINDKKKEIEKVTDKDRHS